MSVGNDVVDLVDPEAHREKQHPRFDERVFASEELQFLRGSEFEHLARWLLWAAKESAYKAEKRQEPDIAFSPRRFVVEAPAIPEGQGAGRGGVRYGERLFALAAEWTAEFVHTIATNDATRAGRSVSGVAPAKGDPSSGARELAMTSIGKLLDIDPRRLVVDGRPPVVRHEGHVLVEDVSLSHHGRFVAFAAVIPRDRLLRDSE